MFRIIYDPETGKKPRFVFVQECATYRNCKLPIPLQIEPAHRCRIPPSVELFNFVHVAKRFLFGIAAVGRCGMLHSDEVLTLDALFYLSTDGSKSMLDVLKFFNPGLLRMLDVLT